MGHGIGYALEAGFPKVYSIELSDKYFGFCTEKFLGNDKVSIIKGDSGQILYDVIKSIDTRITFWLDGHHSGGDTARGIDVSPILRELDQLKKHPIKDHIILVDDLRDLNVGDIMNKILEVNIHYKFLYENGTVLNDILVAIV